jgi:hypothetical protein
MLTSTASHIESHNESSIYLDSSGVAAATVLTHFRGGCCFSGKQLADFQLVHRLCWSMSVPGNMKALVEAAGQCAAQPYEAQQSF